MSQTTPEVTWAQRSSTTEPEKNYIYLTIAAADVPDKSFKVDLKPTSLTFSGYSETKETTYHVELEFFAEIDPSESKTHHTSRDVVFVLRKKEQKQEYWPRLLKDSKKQHFLKTDFDKWVDEDEQDAAPDEDLSGMGGMGDMGGMGGMPGLGGEDGGFGGIDFSKLGGGEGGMPDMSGLGGEGDAGEDGEGDDEDDDEMPGLEDNDEKADEGEGKGKGKADESKPKIEEVS